MGKRIKILFTIPNFDTAGSGKVVHDLVKGIDRNVFEPEICCLHNRGDYFKIIESLGVRIHINSFATPYRPLISFPFRVLKIYRFFKKNKFDIIHSWHWSSDISEPLAAKFARIPFVYTKKSMSWGNKSWNWRSNLSTKIVTVNSDMVAQYFQNKLEKIEQIPFGINTEIFNPKLNFDLNKCDFNFNDTDYVVITIANLVPIKGIEILIEAINSLNDEHIKLLIVGEYNNPYGNTLKTKYESNNIKFIGKQLDVRPYLAIADLFVIPTNDDGLKKGEGLPIAPLEAMSFSRIVLGSDISGIKDILNFKKELLFEPGSINDLKRKFKILRSQDPNDRLILEKEMRQHVLKYYSLENFIKSHESMYSELI